MARTGGSLRVGLLAALVVCGAAGAGDDLSLPASSAPEVDGNGRLDVRELDAFARKLIDARIEKILEADGEEFALPEAEKYRRLVGWLVARAGVVEGLVKESSRLDKNGDGKLSGKEYEAARDLLRRGLYSVRKIDRSGDGLIDRFEFSASFGAKPPRKRSRKPRGQEKPVAKPPGPIAPYDGDGDMSLSVNERIRLAMDLVGGKRRIERAAADFGAMARALESARQAGRTKLARLVEEKKRRKRAEEDKRLRELGGFGGPAPAPGPGGGTR